MSRERAELPDGLTVNVRAGDAGGSPTLGFGRRVTLTAEDLAAYEAEQARLAAEREAREEARRERQRAEDATRRERAVNARAEAADRSAAQQRLVRDALRAQVAIGAIGEAEARAAYLAPRWDDGYGYEYDYVSAWVPWDEPPPFCPPLVVPS